MKKVLIIGPRFYGYNQSISRAFTNLGYNTAVLDYLPGETGSFKERVAYHISRNKKVFFEKQVSKFNQTILSLASNFEPDLVFIIQGNQVHKETLEKLPRVKKILWMMDSIFRAEGAFRIRHYVDAIFSFEKTDVEKLWDAEKIRAKFLPLALDETIYFPLVKRKDIDILFVGALYEQRINMLSAIKKQFPNSKIKVYGRYYSPLRKPFYHLFRNDKDVFLNKNISPEEVNDLYNRSRICLNIHHTQSKYGVNQRFFEITGSKNFQLVDENAFITDYFSQDEIMTFHSLPDLFSKIENLLFGKLETEHISESGYKKIIEGHTFTHRIKEVVAELFKEEQV